MHLRLSLSFASLALLSSGLAHASILPPNNLHLRDNVLQLANMTEAEFAAIVNNIVEQYQPLAKIHGGELSSNNLWSDPTVNASAQQDGNNWVINMYGGLARRPEVTPDGFAMVVCHELGHHFGGFPFYGDADWAASEGQSDFFATQSCARKIWKDEKDLNASFAQMVSPAEKQKCDSSTSKVDDRNLCYRTVSAGQSLANLLSALNNGGVPRTDTPDRSVVRQTVTSHPAAQCRLDTYFSGALCTKPFDEKEIPGKNAQDGQTSLKAEEIASKSSCMQATGWLQGNRPQCWYGPKLEFQAMRFGFTEIKETSGNRNDVMEPGETVSLNFALNNATQRNTEAIKGVLSSSTTGVEVLRKETEWPILTPGASATAQEAFSLRLAPSLACGSKVNVELKATSNQGGTSFTKSLLVGKLVKSDLGENATKIPIPDNNKTGVISEINNATGGNASSAQVTVAIPHEFPSDLTVSLVTPAGNALKVYPQAGGLSMLKSQKEKSSVMAAVGKNAGARKGVFQTFDVNVPAGDTKGIWKLRVVDGSARDVGTLEKWALVLSKSVCESNTQVVSN